MTATIALNRIRQLIQPDEREKADADLLQHFAADRDEAAFAELVRRHGPLVLGVCRRVLGDHHAAEDAFQATFLLLARKATTLNRYANLAGWLHTVARRTARDARRSAALRGERERCHSSGTSATGDELTWGEIRQHLDAEIARLPVAYRQPLILCYLQSLSQAEAALQIGVAPTVLRGRLERGRSMLRRRLERLGLPLAAALLLANAEPVPAALRETTLNTVRAAISGGTAPAAVQALATGMPWLASWRVAAVAAVLTAMVGIVWVGGRPTAVFHINNDEPPRPS